MSRYYLNPHDLDLVSPPASPILQSMSLLPDPTMKQLRFALCSCGKPVYENLDYCSTCLPTQQMQYPQYTLPMRPATQLTPPPSQPGSPKRTLEARTTRTPTRSRSGRPSDASEALTSAFAAEESINLFPQSVYRIPARSTSRSNSSSSSRRPSDSPSRPSSRTLGTSSEPTSRKPSRSGTPLSSDAGYSPMAASFARLSLKNGTVPGEPLRKGSPRPSVELEARMFSGPA